MLKPLSDLDRHEAMIVRHAAYWTAFAKIAPGDRRRQDHSTREAALATAAFQAAGIGKNVLLYAVDFQGQQVMVGYVTPAGEFVGAIRVEA